MKLAYAGILTSNFFVIQIMVKYNGTILIYNLFKKRLGINE